ncbi:MAG: clan AA aspartic protease [Phormidesmis sp. CAN_BIN44]|nr:clan AA aspartic protease [Phormidesmis sp. CAN_BIN44]
MINGTVVWLQARMDIILYPSKRVGVEIECVVDTGFEGFLTLPTAIIIDLGLPYIAPIDANLADNSRITTNVHQGIILWNGLERVIPILSMGRRPLIGTALLEDYHLSIDFCESGTVLIDEIM